MATYAQLAAIHEQSGWIDLSAKIRVAVTVKADAIRQDGAATAAQKAWACRAIRDPINTMEDIRAMIVAANKDAAVEAIIGASDAAIQINVNAAADFFAANG